MLASQGAPKQSTNGFSDRQGQVESALKMVADFIDKFYATLKAT